MGNNRAFYKVLVILLTIAMLPVILSVEASASPATTKSNGSFIVELWNGRTYEQVASLSTDEFQSELKTGIGSITNPRLRIRKAAEGLAFLDSVLLDGHAVSGNKKLLKTDFDVQEIGEAGVILQFTGEFSGNLILTGRIEPKVITGEPFMFPFENTFISDPQNLVAFFTYELGSNLLTVSADGKFEDLGEAFESRFLVPATGHPDGYAYIYISNDDEYLYASADFTSDNTFDYGKDFFKVFASVDENVKEFKQTSSGREYGAASMQYTDKAAYEHMYYEMKIPLGEFGSTSKLQLAFSLYGTSAISTFVSDPASHSFTAGETANGTLRIANFFSYGGSLTDIYYDSPGLNVQFQISLYGIGFDGYINIPYTVQCAIPGNYTITVTGMEIDDLTTYPATPELQIPVQVNATPVSITIQSADRTVAEGENATFSVAADGTAPLNYQWEKSADGGVSWDSIDSATADTLILSAVTLSVSGTQYRCIVDNAAGIPATSDAATLTVVPPITGLPESYTLYTGGRVTWNPQPSGGTWDYDEEYLSLDNNTFTALKAGASTITFSVNGISRNITVTINGSGLPSTGQDFTLAFMLVGLAVVVFTIAIMFYRRRQQV